MTRPSPIEFAETPRGIVLRVQAQPGAKRNAIAGVHAGALKVAVVAAPEKNKANDAIIALLCDRLGLGRSQIRIIAGETSRRKKLLVGDIEADELRRRIERYFAESM